MDRRQALVLAGGAGLTAVTGRRAQAVQGFDAWLETLKAEARTKGISGATLNAALLDVQPIARVIELDRQQPEFTLTFQQYQERVVTETRIAKAREKLVENRDLLASVSADYGVQARFIVALWGIETNFGAHTGGFSVVAALATLAHDGRRSAYFRGELLDALTIIEQGHIAADTMKGSWAGAMGQCQFMPSSFRRFAVDRDGDGRKDIWTTRADVFASAANYLAKSGWDRTLTWGRRVKLPGGFDLALASKDNRKPLSYWQQRGVRRLDGRDLPTRQVEARLVLPADGAADPAYLVYQNYEALLTWNRSNYFACAVGRLADSLIGV